MRLAGALFAILALAACAMPNAAVNIRPGISSDVDLDAIRPPSGVTYTFDMISAEMALRTTLQLTSRRRSETVYDYGGSLIVQVPGDGSDLAEVAELVSAAFRVAGPRIRGNRIFVPVNLRTDNRFRSTASTLLAANDRYMPHDCFAVLGTCTYTASNGTGDSTNVITQTSEEGGIWRSVQRPDPKTTPPGRRGGWEIWTYSIDENAILIDLAITTAGAGPSDTTVFRRR